jgi:hypothetical protein
MIAATALQQFAIFHLPNKKKEDGQIRNKETHQQLKENLIGSYETII